MKPFKIIYNLFFVLIGIIALLLIGSMFPVTGNYKILIVQSGSMAPAVKTGSIVITKPSKEYNVGDIITFGETGKDKVPISHRIYEIKNNNGRLSYITKGDMNNAPDSREVKPEEIIGKIFFSMPYMGYAVNAAKQPIGFICIIGIPAFLIIWDEGKKILAEIKKIKEKNKQQDNL